MSYLFNNDRVHPVPGVGTVWVDEGGNPYTIKSTTRNEVYMMWKGFPCHMGIGEFRDEMSPIDDLLEAML